MQDSINQPAPTFFRPCSVPRESRDVPCGCWSTSRSITASSVSDYDVWLAGPTEPKAPCAFLRGMVRTSVIVAAALALLACSDALAPVTVGAPYLLRTVNGQPLPWSTPPADSQYI